MKYLVGSDIGSYTFDVSAKTITLTDVPDIVSNQVIQIFNFTRNVVIYEFIKTRIVVEGGNVITLFETLHAMQDSDLLQIYIDIPQSLVSTAVGNDFYLEVSKGNILNHSDYGCFGINPNIGTGTAPEDIQDGGGVFVPPTTYRIHAVVSNSANDTSAGTGARTVRIFGIISTGLAEETVILNGLTPVNTVNSYSDIYRMVVYTAGSGLTNAGIITATAAVDATVTITIQVNGYNASRRAIRQIPPGYTGHLYNWKAGMSQATSSNNAFVYLLTKVSGGLWITRGLHSLNNTGTSNETDEYKIPLVLVAGEFVKVQCASVSANNTIVQADINIILFKL